MLRSIKQAYDLIKKDDPESAISTYTLRLWCAQNKVKNLRSGKKILLDIESLYDYINKN